MSKTHKRFSRATGSELAKLKKLEQRGWKPGAGFIGDWLRSPKRQKRAFGVSEAVQ